MKSKWIFFALFFITLLAAILRIYNLSSIPTGAGLDEVSNGYNAYSFLHTGRDEYGQFLPILTQAYNDFRPALMDYFTVPFVTLFGLTIFAVRLPSVVLTLLATISLFFLTRELCFSSRHSRAPLLRSKYPWGEGGNLKIDIFALLVAFLYAISPWSIFSSRLSNEINMSLSFFIFALTFFLYAINRKFQTQKNIISFFISIVCFVIAFYAYHGIKLFLPFFIIPLGIVFWRQLWEKKYITLGGFALGFVLLLPLIITFLNPATRVRLSAVNIFSQNQDITTTSSQLILHDKASQDTIGELIHNRRLLIAQLFLRNSLANFSFVWLFLPRADNIYQVPEFGPFYLFELPLLLLGFYALIKTDMISSKIKWILFIWIITSVIPSGVSNQSPHLNRTNNMLPALTIVQGFGLFFLFGLISKTKNIYLKKSYYLGTAIIILLSFGWFLHAYFIDFPYQDAAMYPDTMQQAFVFAESKQNKYDKIVVSNRGTLLESYMYYLFTSTYNPALYQKNGGTKSAFLTDTHLIGKYDFRDPNVVIPDPTHHGKILYVVNSSELSNNVVQLYQLHEVEHLFLPNDQSSIVLLEGKY